MEIKLMVESIVRELVKSLQAEAAKPPKVLYVFCDSTAHEAFSDHFILLKNNGIHHDILFLDGQTSGWLGLHKVESGGPGKIIAADEHAPAPLELPMEYDGIIIPELDLDNAARVALGMKGTVKSEIIFSALVLNKFVLVGNDISGLKRADRRTLNTLSLPAPYKKLFEYYKLELAQLGIQFAPREQLAEIAVSNCGKNAESTTASIGKQDDLAAERSETVSFDGKLVNANWVKQQSSDKNFTRLILGKGTLLSPLAKDMLKEKGIAVHYADER